MSNIANHCQKVWVGQILRCASTGSVEDLQKIRELALQLQACVPEDKMYSQTKRLIECCNSQDMNLQSIINVARRVIEEQKI